jgi:hypothetical protein
MFENPKKTQAAHTPPKKRADSDEDIILVNAYCTCGEVAPPRFPHVLHGQRNLADPELKSHLGGFFGYLRSNGTLTQMRYHVLRHIQRTRQQWSFSIASTHLHALADWAGRANAIIFLPDGNVRDPQGRILIAAADGSSDPLAKVPYPPLAWLRKRRTEAVLAQHDLHAPAYLPPLVSEPELQLRDARSITERALAVFIAALRAESLASDTPISIQEIRSRMPLAFDQMSPEELSFMANPDPSSEDIAKFGWRYEGLFVLLWALGVTDDLPFPEGICDVSQVAATMLELDAEAFMQTARTRPAGEILDALDLHYRLHWVIRQARTNEEEHPQDLNDGVVFERHYALNWLIQFEDCEWDNVDTPT